MSKTITINGTDRTSVVRLAGQVWAEVAERGAVGIGGLDLSDEGGAITVPAMKAITVDESAASPVRLFTGYTAEPGIARGPYRVGTDRAWDVDVFDINTLLDDRLLTAGANRPEESDYARVTWLLTTTAMTGISVTAGVVPNTNTVTMDAVDYRGATPRRVLDECAEMAGKNFFLYRHSSGPLLYYDLESGTSLSSTARFSTVAADVDSATTWAVAIEGHTQDTGRIFSRLKMTFAQGSVWVDNPTTASTYRTREIAFVDKSIKTEEKATAKALKYLAASAVPTERFTLMVRLPAANVNDIRAGQRAEIKIPHLGISSFTYYRCVRREIGPAGNGESVSDVMYDVRLEFAKNAFPTRFREQHTDEENTGLGSGGGGGYDGGGTGGTSGTSDPCCAEPYDPNGPAIGDSIYDNFNRTIVEDENAEALIGYTSADGHIWNVTGVSETSYDWGVDGSRAFFEIAGFTATSHTVWTLQAGEAGIPERDEMPFGTGYFSMLLKFQYALAGPLAGTSANGGNCIYFFYGSGIPHGGFGGASVIVLRGDNAANPGIAVVEGSHASRAAAIAAGDYAEVAAVAEGVDLLLRWERRGDTARARIWQDGDPEPSTWQVETAVDRTGGADDTFCIKFIDQPETVGQRFEIDWVAFGRLPTSGQEVANEPTGLGDGVTTSFLTARPYTRGGLRVAVDGVDVTSSATESDPETGTYTLDFAPESDETITTRYVAA